MIIKKVPCFVVLSYSGGPMHGEPGRVPHVDFKIIKNLNESDAFHIYLINSRPTSKICDYSISQNLSDQEF